MKFYLIILSTFFLLPGPDSFSQLRLIKTLDNIDFMIGSGVSTLRGTNSFDENSVNKIGYFTGFNFNYNNMNCERCSLSVRLLFEKKGNKTEKEIFYYIDAATQQLKMGKQIAESDLWAFTLPLLWQYRIKEGSTNFYAEAGGFGSLIKKMKFKFSSPDQGSYTTTLNNINEFDWGLSLGIRAEIIIKEKTTLVTGILSNIGLTNISNVAAKTTCTSLYIGTPIMKSRRK